MEKKEYKEEPVVKRFPDRDVPIKVREKILYTADQIESTLDEEKGQEKIEAQKIIIMDREFNNIRDSFRPLGTKIENYNPNKIVFIFDRNFCQEMDEFETTMMTKLKELGNKTLSFSTEIMESDDSIYMLKYSARNGIGIYIKIKNVDKAPTTYLNTISLLKHARSQTVRIGGWIKAQTERAIDKNPQISDEHLKILKEKFTIDKILKKLLKLKNTSIY